MNRKVVLGIAFIIILGFTGFLSSFFISKKELPPQRPKVEVKNYVRVVPVKYEEVPVEVEAFGRVGSSQQLNLVAEVGGRLEPGNISLKEGQNFQKGQVLAKINSNEQKLTLQSRKSNFLNLFAGALPDLRIDYPENYEKWLKYYNAIDLDKDLPEMPSDISVKEKTFLATQTILGEYYAIKSLEENLRKYTLYAPYNGSIQSVATEVGSVVNPGATIASIIRTDRLELKVPIELKDIDFVKIGANVAVGREGTTSKSWTGKVVRKADFVDPNTQSIAVYISLDSSEDNIYEGLYLRATIPGKVIPQAMRIDRSILQNKDEVFIVNGDRLETKVVNVEKIFQSEAIINGLREGDQLVIEAPSNASNNMKVDIVNN